VHPNIILIVSIPQVLVGQIMHRLKLTWLGGEGNLAQSAATFRILLIITAVHFCLNFVLYITSISFFVGGDEDVGLLLSNARSVLNIAFGVFGIFIVARTRGRIRARYGIPERRCIGCEDCCRAFWCACCTVSQMARHTADYENYAALCCGETGLSPNAPSIV
jgi:Cys-rich protein (TIGR01571 family)